MRFDMSRSSKLRIVILDLFEGVWCFRGEIGKRKELSTKIGTLKQFLQALLTSILNTLTTSVRTSLLAGRF
jgi:hypothetical protein